MIQINTSPTHSVKENLKAVMAVAATTDSGNAITYSITGGSDAALFSLAPANGILAFNSAPDFEAPADANGDNVYEVTVEASDGADTASQSIQVTVVDIDDALEKISELGAAVAVDMANLELATNALSTNKADKTALDLANAAIQNLTGRIGAAEGKLDVPGTVTEAIDDKVTALRNDLLNGVSVEFDTFKEVADQFAANGDLIAALQNIGAGAVRFDVAQVLTLSQQARARLNIGAASQADLQEHKAAMGNPDNFDPVASYQDAKAATKAQ